MDIIFGFLLYMCKVKGFESDSSHYVEACLFLVLYDSEIIEV